MPLPLAVRLFEMLVLRKLEFPQESPAGEEKGWCQLEEEFLCKEEVSYSSNNLSDHLAGETGAQTLMVQ